MWDSYWVCAREGIKRTRECVYVKKFALIFFGKKTFINFDAKIEAVDTFCNSKIHSFFSKKKIYFNHFFRNENCLHILFPLRHYDKTWWNAVQINFLLTFYSLFHLSQKMLMVKNERAWNEDEINLQTFNVLFVTNLFFSWFEPSTFSDRSFRKETQWVVGKS